MRIANKFVTPDLHETAQFRVSETSDMSDRQILMSLTTYQKFRKACFQKKKL